MKILFVYPNVEGYGRIPLGMSLIMTILKNAGHTLELFDVTFIVQDKNLDNKARESFKTVKSTNTDYLYNYHTLNEIDELFASRIKKFKPDIVAFSIVEDNYRYAHRLLKLTKSLYPGLATIVGGSTPTIAAEVLIKNPYIDYLIKGEAELAMAEFCAAWDKGEDLRLTQGLWYKQEGKVYSNQLGPLINLDELPIQDLDFWDDAHFIKPYDGKVYRTGSIEMSRGCPQKCTYCINETLRNTYYESGNKLIRKKTVINTVREAKYLKEKHNLELFFFCDDNFLALTRKKMEEFKKLWKKEVNTPFWINTTIESVTDWRLAALLECGCVGIGIGVESGNEWFRKHVLKRGRGNENHMLLEKFDLIKKYGIRVSSNAMFGFPGETLADMYETIKLIKTINPPASSLFFVAPYIGTPIHLLAKDQGLIDCRTEDGFKGMAYEIGVRRGPMIRNNGVSNEIMNGLVRDFIDYVEGRLPIPDEFVCESSGASVTADKRMESLEEAAFIDGIFVEAEAKKDMIRNARKINKVV
ncbi:MAG: B12-binding domain-containing radical SAM protein [Candidatus Brocadiales bacterium]|nr:B12-binding domain-containing radical SAM protein [Candidatus Brocadiales bacterium]